MIKNIKNILIYIVIMLAAIIFFSGCSSDKNIDSEETVVNDSIKREIKIPIDVERVVVANRYNMEIIKSINAIDKVVGVDYGIYQDQEAYGDFFTKEQVIGKGQNDLNYEKIIELNPQLLIITGNGNWKDAEQKLEPFGIKVIVLNAYYTDEFKKTYTIAGKIFNREKEAKEFIDYFGSKLDYINNQLKNQQLKTVYYEYKNEGVTTIPGDYFYKMLEYAHADNILKNAKSLQIDTESVVENNPDYIVKVGDKGIEPKYIPPTVNEFLMRKKNIISRPGWETLSAVKNDRILLLSQYAHGGASKIVGTCYIAKFLYPEYLPDLHPEEVFKEWVTKYQHLPYIKGHTYPAFSLDD